MAQDDTSTCPACRHRDAGGAQSVSVWVKLGVGGGVKEEAIRVVSFVLGFI